jgi:hypothetical protein
MFFNQVEFPEFLHEQEVYQLDSVDEDEDSLITRGKELVEKDYLEIGEFKIRQREDHYGLYVR